MSTTLTNTELAEIARKNAMDCAGREEWAAVELWEKIESHYRTEEWDEQRKQR